ncbi:MAG: hypothetical protein VB032_08395 [Burkholderiaceae bacterium]|nr:hypothetical protein [Burkholderiaceae bacterium]
MDATIAADRNHVIEIPVVATIVAATIAVATMAELTAAGLTAAALTVAALTVAAANTMAATAGTDNLPRNRRRVPAVASKRAANAANRQYNSEIRIAILAHAKKIR